jgi:hypothetical protein
VPRLPPQCTFWRFLASLHLSVAGQILRVTADHAATGLAGRARGSEDDYAGRRHYGAYSVRPIRWAGRKGYNPKNRGKKSYQPILTFLAETREYVGGELRNGDRPTGRQIARHLDGVFAALPDGVSS